MTTQALEIIQQQRRELILSPVMDLNLAKSRMEQFQQFVQYYLEPSTDGGLDGGDYGPIPGAGKKKVLLKSGADKLCELYAIYDEYTVEQIEDFDKKLFYYKITCILKSRRDDSIVGTGVGSCSTYESKYRWRDEQRKCPKCDAATIIKGKDDFGGGWLCWAKKGGCGAKFKDGDVSIEGQKIGRIENPDIMDTVNTVLKMAKKRAKIDAVIGVTRSSGIFTQDLDDVPMPPTTPPVERTETAIPIKPLRPESIIASVPQDEPHYTDALDAREAKGIREMKSAATNNGQDGTSQKGGTPSAAADTAIPVTNPLPEVNNRAGRRDKPADEGSASGNGIVESFITPKQASDLHKDFRKIIKKELPSVYLQIDHLFYGYMKKHDFVTSNGEPSASMVLTSQYKAVVADLLVAFPIRLKNMSPEGLQQLAAGV